MSVPLVSLSSFTNLAGPSLADDLRRLVAEAACDSLALFSDPRGEHLALLPVGAGQQFRRVEELHGLEIEGLRPLCVMNIRGGEARPAASDDRARELERLEQSLAARERYITDCEHRMAEVGHNLSEREAMLEQREQMLIEKEREFFRLSGELANKTETTLNKRNVAQG